MKNVKFLKEYKTNLRFKLIKKARRQGANCKAREHRTNRFPICGRQAGRATGQAQKKGRRQVRSLSKTCLR